jgi:hypothetical protein
MQITLSLNEFQGVTSGINNQIAERLALEFYSDPYAIPPKRRGCDSAIFTIGHGTVRATVSASLPAAKASDNYVVDPSRAKVTLLMQTRSHEVGAAWTANPGVGEHGKFHFCASSIDGEAIDEIIPLIAKEVRKQLGASRPLN